MSQRLAELKVLAVDNNGTSSGIVAGYLSALGIQVVSLASGRDAIKRLESTGSTPSFDLVVLDADVGDMSGLATAREIRASDNNQRIKIVLLNPTAADLDDEQWRSAGIDECLPKPIRQSMLYECLLMLTASTGSFATRKMPRETDVTQFEPLTGRVLLVEDNPVNQAVALGMLEEIGCETVVAANGQEAVDRCTNEDFDIVLMDCEMPVMDGFTATAAIRDRATDAPKVPIIAVTANAINGDRERCIAAGMQDYISKPISPEKLHGTLRKWLQGAGHNGIAPDVPDSIDTASLENIGRLQGVGGDKMIRQVVDLYLSSSLKLVKDLRARLSQGDAEAVRQVAHALKSSSLTVGACELATLAQRLEEMGRSGKLVDAEKCSSELDNLYPKTVLALKVAIDRVAVC